MTHTFSTKIGQSSYTIDIEKVWALVENKQPKPIPLSELEHTLNWGCWGMGTLTPKKVLEHLKRVTQADLNYPIVIVRDEYDRVSHVIDGMHRIVKAFANELDSISALEVSENFIKENSHKQDFCDACGCDPCDCHWGDM